VDELIGLSLGDTNQISRLLVPASDLIEFGWTVAGEGVVALPEFIPPLYSALIAPDYTQDVVLAEQDELMKYSRNAQMAECTDTFDWLTANTVHANDSAHNKRYAQLSESVLSQTRLVGAC
jgi:hypothetical protein